MGNRRKETGSRKQEAGNKKQEIGKMRHNFKNLDVWKLARELCKEIYEITNNFPTEERFGLTSQIRRCAVSIPSNIAEGTSRTSDKDFSRFLDIALGSCFELETQIILSMDLGFLENERGSNLQNKIQKVEKMLQGLYNKIQKNIPDS